VSDEAERLRTGKISVLNYADINACPHTIFLPSHYRDDGTCKCDDPDQTEMADWGYTWRDGQWR
jgi:hypothetical protein